MFCFTERSWLSFRSVSKCNSVFVFCLTERSRLSFRSVSGDAVDLFLTVILFSCSVLQKGHGYHLDLFLVTL